MDVVVFDNRLIEPESVNQRRHDVIFVCAKQRVSRYFKDSFLRLSFMSFEDVENAVLVEEEVRLHTPTTSLRH
jgi:hypothetical protein